MKKPKKIIHHYLTISHDPPNYHMIITEIGDWDTPTRSYTVRIPQPRSYEVYDNFNFNAPTPN